jgi:hypothetical protein
MRIGVDVRIAGIVTLAIGVAVPTTPLADGSPSFPPGWAVGGLVVHGPYELTTDELLGAPFPSLDAPDEIKAVVANTTVSCTPCPAQASKTSIGVTPVPPPPTNQPFLTGLQGGDPMIAAGKAALLVARRGTLAFYGKDGNALPSIVDGTPMKLLTSANLFGHPQLQADINAWLNLPAKFNNSAFYVDNASYQEYIDLRVLYDDYRHRFWIASEIVNGKTRDQTSIDADPDVRYARRNKMVVGVSKTSDPRKGFWLYWWNNAADDGACTDIPVDRAVAPPLCANSGYRPGDGADYPHLGVSRHQFLEGTHVATNFASGNWHGTYGLINVVDADALASGHANPGWFLYNLMFVPANQADYIKAGDATPVVGHKDGDLGDVAYFVHFTNTTSDLALWSLSFPGGFGSPPNLTYQTPAIAPWAWARNAPQSGPLGIREYSVLYNPAYRNGSVYLAFGVCEPPGGNGCKNAVRFLQFNPTANSGTYTTIPIGPPNQFVAAPVLDAGFPALDVNAAGDLAIGFVTSSPSTFAGAGYVPWYHNELLPRAHVQLQHGLASITEAGDPGFTSKVDTGGASADPFDNESIWLAHAYAGGDGTWRIVAGKVFGKKFPNVIISGAALAAYTLSAGSSTKATVAVANIGDGDAPAGRVTLFLSRDATIGRDDTSIGTVDLPALASGRSVTIDVPVTIPSDTAPAAYYIGAIVDLAGDVVEYDTTDNVTDLERRAPQVTVTECRDCVPRAPVEGSAASLSRDR